MTDSTTMNRFTLLRALFLLGVQIAPVEIALAFVPSTTRSPPCRRSMFRLSHDHPSCPTHHVGARQSSDLEGTKRCRQRRRQRRERGFVLAARPPDDFIDTTATEDEGSSSYLGVDFERQELRVIFEAMDKSNIFYKMLTVDQITEILQFVQALLSVKQTPTEIAKLLEGDAIKGKWKLEFSTEDRYKLLPASTDIYNYIYDGSGGGRLDNVIRFYKSWVLKSVRAVSKYRMEAENKVVFEFERIEANILGFKIPLPKFSSDAGFVEVQYFDGDLWIEVFEGPAMDKSQTMTVINIYRRVGDLTEEDKTCIPERTGEQRQPQR